MSIPIPATSVREAREKLQNALDDVRRLTNQLGRELLDLEIYAREQTRDFGPISDSARDAYRDMADRIKAIRGEA